MAKKQNPEILGCASLRGRTHSILAYSLPVLSRKIVEYVSSLFFLLFSSPSGVFYVLKGGTHSILVKRRNWENSEFQRFLSPLPPRSLKSTTTQPAVGGPKTFWEDQRAWRPKNLAAQRDEGTKVLRRQTTGGTKKYLTNRWGTKKIRTYVVY